MAKVRRGSLHVKDEVRQSCAAFRCTDQFTNYQERCIHFANFGHGR
jgi:hypothetical protein